MASIVILGLSITSSWGNGHATTWRGLVKALARRGHRVQFLERDMPWYAANRDLPEPPYGRTLLYRDPDELERRCATMIAEADAVIIGSYVPDGVAVGHFVLDRANGPVLFYDIDTPVTLAKLEAGDEEYVDVRLLGRYDGVLSFTGGPVLERLRSLGARFAAPLYCSVDPEVHAPRSVPRRWRMGYLGTYSPDRQPTLEELLLEPARQSPAARFVVAGPQFPSDIDWPANVGRIEHLAPADHADFYCAQDITLNVTRADMRRAGYAPSVRIFEAAACGVPILSDPWPGLDTVLRIGSEILVAEDSATARRILEQLGEDERQNLAQRARAAVLARHTAQHRAEELEGFIAEAAANRKAAA